MDPSEVKDNFWRHYTLKDSFIIALPLLQGLVSFEDLNLPNFPNKNISSLFFYVKKSAKNGIIATQPNLRLTRDSAGQGVCATEMEKLLVVLQCFGLF